jgi:endonuclease/exonuclease/phosphatase family metal-dependent hydrolase
MNIMRKFFRIIIILLNIVAAISLALACLCSFVNPKTIWWIGFFGLAYMYLLAINIGFIAFWALFGKKKMMLISLIPILIGWSFIGKNLQWFEKEIPEEDTDRSIQVFSFNVQGFEQMNQKQPDGKTLNIFDFINEKDPDIICLQEFVYNRWHKELNEKNITAKLKLTPYYHNELHNGDYGFGVATFSKYPIIHKELIYSDNTANACICSDLLIGADTVRVYNIHLKSVGFQNEEKELLDNVVKREYDRSDVRVAKTIIRQIRNSSFIRAQQVEILSSHIASSPYPVIICGDFNDPPTSYSYRKVRGNRKDAFVEAGSGRSTTFDIGRIASLRIDCILYSDDFKAYHYERPRVLLSDHFPVMCRLVKLKLSEKETQ